MAKKEKIVDLKSKPEKITDEQLEKIQKMNSFLIDNLSNKMKILKDEMKVIDDGNEKMGRFNVMAEEAEQKVQRLDQDLKKGKCEFLCSLNGIKKAVS